LSVDCQQFCFTAMPHIKKIGKVICHIRTMGEKEGERPIERPNQKIRDDREKQALKRGYYKSRLVHDGLKKEGCSGSRGIFVSVDERKKREYMSIVIESIYEQRKEETRSLSGLDKNKEESIESRREHTEDVVVPRTLGQSCA